MPNKIITRMDVVTEARTWLSTPFVHQGWTKGVACDCIGLIKGVGVELGLFDYDEQSDKGAALCGLFDAAQSPQDA
jgi:hypothetical protein